MPYNTANPTADIRRRQKKTPMDTEMLQGVYRTDCENAVDWIESNISAERETADAYYRGECRIKPIPGRSKVIVTVVRDSIKTILPNLARIFTQTDQIVEFSSDDEEDEQICQQMTMFVSGVYNKFGGYTSLIQATTNALKSKVGVIKVRLDQIPVPSHQITAVESQEELQQLQDEMQGGESMVTEVSPPQQGEDGATQQQVAITTISYRNKWTLECTAPETLIVDINATCVEDARLIGIRQEMAIWQAVEMGLSADALLGIPTGDDSAMLSNERNRRLNYDSSDYQSSPNDPLSRRIIVTETWNRLDVDGDGIAELRHIIAIGPNYVIQVNEPINCVPLALFYVDLQPNVFFPISLAEDMEQDQDVQTSITRSIVDNVAYVNSPRTAINESKVNLEDAKNTEIGAIIRTKAPGQIEELVTPFVAGQTLPVLEYLHQVGESRSGVTKLSQGLDPNALQATSRIAANAAVTGSDARIEMMARNIAETGVVQLSRAILRVAMYQLKGNVSIKTPGGFKAITPNMWHDQINITANVGLGNGRIEEKQPALQTVIQIQGQALQQFGLKNPLVTWDNYRNSIKQYLRLAGIRNISDYFPHVLPDAVNQFADQLQQQQQAAQQKQQAPAPDLVGAAKVKAESDIQINQAKIQAQQQADIQKLTVEQQKVMAQIQAKLQQEMAALQAKLQQEMIIQFAEIDQRRDEANQQFGVDAFKTGVDALTQAHIARENATNQLQMPGARKPNGNGAPQ